MKSKDKQMRRLVKQMERCYLCPFAFHRSNIVPYSGSIDAPVALVGEGPGREEDDSGEAFVGPAGRDMTEIMTSFGIKRIHLFIANILKCRPQRPYALKNNQTPTLVEVENCFWYLWEQMKIVKPRLVVLVGATAAKWVLNKSSITMGQVINEKNKLELFGKNEVDWECDYTVMYHPAGALHDPSRRKDVNKNMRDTFHRVKSYMK